MAPKAQKEPSWMGGGGNNGPWGQRGPRLFVFFIVHLRPARASKELKYWSSWPQDFMALTPSVKRPLVGIRATLHYDHGP